MQFLLKQLALLLDDKLHNWEALSKLKLSGSLYQEIHEFDEWDDHVPDPDDDVLEDLLEAASHRPCQDCQLQDGGEENPRQNSFTDNLRQSDKAQGSVKCKSWLNGWKCPRH